MDNIIKLRVSRWYWAAAIQLLNVFLVLVVLNVGLFVFFSVFDHLRGGSPEEKEKLFHGFSQQMLAPLYPDWEEEELTVFLAEEDTMPYMYDAWSQLKIGATTGRYINVSEHGFQQQIAPPLSTKQESSSYDPWSHRLIKDQGSWPPDPMAFNVFVFGGSTTFGTGVADEQTIASFLQEFLRQGGDQDIFVYNFGRPGSFSTTERQLFEQLVIFGFTPDVAIFIDGLNEFLFWDGAPHWTDQLTDLVLRHNEKRELISRSWYDESTDILRHVPMYRVARTAKGYLNRLTRDDDNGGQEVNRIGDPPFEDRTALQVAIHKWSVNHRLTRLVADEFSVQPVFVWHPSPQYKYDLAYHPLYAGDPIYFQVTQRAQFGYELMDEMRPTSNLGDDFLWLADMQDGKKENLYVDHVHFTGAFSQEIASRIYQHLAQQDLLPGS